MSENFSVMRYLLALEEGEKGKRRKKGGKNSQRQYRRMGYLRTPHSRAKRRNLTGPKRERG